MKTLLKEKGPLLSSELIDYLVKTKKIKPETARKRLSRLKPPITKIKGLFADNQALYHLQEQYKQDIFYEGLINAFETQGKRYYAVINAIEYHYGYIKKTELQSFTFSPIHNLKGHKKLDTIISNLKKYDILFDFNEYYVLNPVIKSFDNFNHYKAIETARNFILIQFSDWIRNIGFTSYNTAKYHSQFGKFSWTFVSPSYVTTLVKFNNGKIIPAYIVADILIGNKINIKDVEFFTKKIAILKKLKGLPNFLPFLIVDDLPLKTLKYLKEKGIVIGFIDQLFGSHHKELLKTLINTITNAGAILKKNPEQYLDLMSNLTKLVEGKTNNLKGDLFELAIGYYHSQFSNYLEIGKLINYQGKVRELDMISVRQDKVYVAECKGYKSRIEKKELENWVSQKVTIIRKWLINESSYKNKEIYFEFWSSGGFTDEAKEYIKNYKPKKYSIEFIDENDLLKKADEIPSKKFKEILKNYYLKEI